MHALALALPVLAAAPPCASASDPNCAPAVVAPTEPAGTGSETPATSPVTSPADAGTEPVSDAPTPATPPATEPVVRPPPAAGVVAPASPPAPARPRWWGPTPRPKVSGYGGPALRLSGLHGSFAALIGLEAGINVMQRATIGASVLWLLNPVEAREYAVGPASRLNLNYGGLVVDVSYVKRKRVAGTIGGLLGGGGACVQNPENGVCAAKTAFFVGEPRLGVRVVLAPIVRLHVAVGYRLVAGRAWTGPPDARMFGPSGSVTLEFGWF